jgi:hypothetical protein
VREHGKIYSKFWTNPDIDGLSARTKIVALYLLSCERLNLLGCYKLPLGYAACDLRINHDDLRSDFADLERAGFCLYDAEAEFVFVCHYLKFNRLENQNQGKALASLFDLVPRSSWLHERLVDAICDYCPRFLPERFITNLKNERASRS